MAQTAANLMTSVLPEAPLRQWVLTLPYGIRHRLAYDSNLLGKVVRAFLGTVLGFYKKRCGVSGAVAVIQRTSSDLKLNPHVHAVFLDGGYQGESFVALGHLRGSDVAEVLTKAKRRIERVLERANERTSDEAELPLLTAVTGRPPAGPALLRRIGDAAEPVLVSKLCVTDEGYNLHAATTAGAADTRGREALLRYILRPPVAQERIVQGPDGLVRIVLKKQFSDGTIAIDLDPVSLLLRLCSSVPAPRVHTTRYCGVLGSASKLRPNIVPQPEQPEPVDGSQGDEDEPAPKRGCRYWGWAELLARSFELDVTVCPNCGGHMKLVALVKDKDGVASFLRKLGEPTDVPPRSAARAPPYFKSAVIRRLTSGDLAVA